MALRDAFAPTVRGDGLLAAQNVRHIIQTHADGMVRALLEAVLREGGGTGAEGAQQQKGAVHDGGCAYVTRNSWDLLHRLT